MSGLEADMAVDDTCSPSRNYVLGVYNSYNSYNICIKSSESPRLSSSFFPGSQVWIVA